MFVYLKQASYFCSLFEVSFFPRGNFFLVLGGWVGLGGWVCQTHPPARPVDKHPWCSAPLMWEM